MCATGSVHKRALLAGALLLVTLAAFTVVLASGFWPVALAGVIGALANSTVGTTLAAVSLGVVGMRALLVGRRATRPCFTRAVLW